MRRPRYAWFLLLLVPSPLAVWAAGTAASANVIEFCLQGEFDLGVRLQGMRPEPGEVSAATWCVITEDDSQRVHFRASGQSNPDMSGTFAVSYIPPETVRIVNREAPPDVEFAGADISAEARRNRRIDPHRLVEELAVNPGWVAAEGEDGWRRVRYPGSAAEVEVRITDRRLRELRTTADLPLRGSVSVRWGWDWPPSGEPTLTLEVDGEVAFGARATRRSLAAEEAAALWSPSGGQPPREAPADAWPARSDMRLEPLSSDAYLVLNVRTGFHHLVVDTEEGLVVGDAPAGWVELHQIPPTDLVPGLGISGLSERLVDFLAERLPDRPIRAVVLTHAHDDHAGGARAFAAAGAEIFAPAGVAGFVEVALNRPEMPADRLANRGDPVTVTPVLARTTLGGAGSRVELIALGPGPHASASLGLWAVEQGLFFQSDLHVPNSELDSPRTDRAATECWFANWAVSHLPSETLVLSSHTTLRTPVSRLARYLTSEGCQ